MTMITVLNTATGQMKSLSRVQLNSVLLKHRREAARMLKKSRADHVLYALRHTSTNYHIIPCTIYTESKYKACFGRNKKIAPLAVHRK